MGLFLECCLVFVNVIRDETILTYLTNTATPHGGKLIDRTMTIAQKLEFIDLEDCLSEIQLDRKGISDLLMIATGAYSPLTGFMNKIDYQRVLKEMRLGNGLLWPIPVTLSVEKKQAIFLKEGSWVRLNNAKGQFIGILELTQKYQADSLSEATTGTQYLEHSSIEEICGQELMNLAGPVWLLHRWPHPSFRQYQIDPLRSRQVFQEKGWSTVAGFQPHHVYKCTLDFALKIVDGLFLSPLINIDLERENMSSANIQLQLRDYETVFNYFLKDRINLSSIPRNTHYSGLREAIFRILIFKNYGCTHFIVDDDDGFDSQRNLNQFIPELDITLIDLNLSEPAYTASLTS